MTVKFELVGPFTSADQPLSWTVNLKSFWSSLLHDRPVSSPRTDHFDQGPSILDRNCRPPDKTVRDIHFEEINFLTEKIEFYKKYKKSNI